MKEVYRYEGYMLYLKIWVEITEATYNHFNKDSNPEIRNRVRKTLINKHGQSITNKQ